MVAWFGDGGLIMIVLTPTHGGDAANVMNVRFEDHLDGGTL